ncbi:KCTD3 [Scenedesmus sp. PABB004]|nr:KCTD3 [Scenedesmus sp. PABB004]
MAASLGGEPSAGGAAGAQGDGDEAVVRLCVGGARFATTRATLTAAPGSYLATLFGGRWEPATVGGEVFIDRDPDSFKWVLSYLRWLRGGGTLVLPDAPLALRQLRAEADFLGLPGLARAAGLGRLAADGAGLQHPGGADGGGDGASAGAGGAGGGEQQLPTLAQAVVEAQRLLAAEREEVDPQVTELAALVLRHVLTLPLAAAQPDLLAALASPEAGAVLEFAMVHQAAGDPRMSLECHLAPARALVGEVAEIGDPPTPGPGWGRRVWYHRFTAGISNTEVGCFVLRTAKPGEALATERVARADFAPELARCALLHKLLVQQAPRRALAAFVAALRGAGFARVAVSTEHMTYGCMEGPLARFPGIRGIVTLEL